MLKAHPVVLHRLVEQYGRIRDLHTAQGTCDTYRQLEDVTYTLCVSTGTRTAEAALVVAEEQLAAAFRDESAASVELAS